MPSPSDLSQLLRQAADHLRAGGVVAFPTETVYGLGALASDASAVARVFAIKGRPAHNPLIVHAADRAMARPCASVWTAAAEALGIALWPGPVTLVVPAAEWVPSIVRAGGPTVAVRVPDHPIAQSLIRAVGEPIVGPSANRSGHVSPTTAEHVRQDLAHAIGEGSVLVLDGGACAVGLESTVYDVERRSVLRPGAVSADRIAAIIGSSPESAGPDGAERGPSDEPIARSPGLLGPHYQPATPTLLCAAETLGDVLGGWSRAVVVHAGAIAVPSRHERVALPTDAAGYARRLYAALRAADGMRAQAIVVVDPVPAGAMSADESWLWRAVMDRLHRACAQGSGGLGDPATTIDHA